VPGLLFPLLIASTRVAIVPIVGADDRAGIQRVVDAVGPAVEEHYGLTPIALDELYHLELTTTVPRCGTDQACVRAAIQSSGAGLGVVVVLNRRIEPMIVQVELVSVDPSVEPVRSAPTSLGPSEDEDAALDRLTKEVLRRAKHQRAARIEVVSEPRDATIAIDGVVQSSDRERRSIKVQPGTRKITVTREGYFAFDAQRLLAAGDVWELEARLEAKPEDGSLLASPWFWVATIGAVVAGAVVTGVAVSGTGERRICVFNPENTDPCRCP
jgi:hypothetical protein